VFIRRQRTRTLASGLALIAGVGLSAAFPAQAAAPDILDQLRAVPGLTVLSEQPAPAGFRFFFLT
jgi:hypothetical protein